MIDTALLTERGIVFCLFPDETIAKLQEAMRRVPNNRRLLLTVSIDEREHVVKGENILVRYFLIS